MATPAKPKIITKQSGKKALTNLLKIGYNLHEIRDGLESAVKCITTVATLSRIKSGLNLPRVPLAKALIKFHNAVCKDAEAINV